MVFRPRRRGRAIEATICDELTTSADPRRQRRARRTVARSGATYLIWARQGWGADDFVPAAGQGPVVTWRAVADEKPPSLKEWDLSLGLVELL